MGAKTRIRDNSVEIDVRSQRSDTRHLRCVVALRLCWQICCNPELLRERKFRRNPPDFHRPRRHTIFRSSDCCETAFALGTCRNRHPWGAEPVVSILNLEKIFDPHRVAVIGASDSPASVGYTVLRNLIGSGFRGVVYPVNPQRESIQGVQAYRDIKDLPHPPDLAVICTRALTVPGWCASWARRARGES